jgi:hypothetical protein
MKIKIKKMTTRILLLLSSTFLLLTAAKTAENCPGSKVVLRPDPTLFPLVSALTPLLSHETVPIPSFSSHAKKELNDFCDY